MKDGLKISGIETVIWAAKEACKVPKFLSVLFCGSSPKGSQNSDPSWSRFD
jgi:hypothetical protein